MDSKPNSKKLSDKEFLLQFENQTLDPIYFDHTGHIKLAWLYLSNHSLEQAIDLTCTGIKAYAESLGADDKFHLTITHSLVKIIDKRIQKLDNEELPTVDWSIFVNHNLDLFNNSLEILAEHFSKNVLFSETAKNKLVKPDLIPL